MFQTCFWIPLLHNFFFNFPLYQLTTCVSSAEDVLCPQMSCVAMLTCSSEDLSRRESPPPDAFKCVSGVYKLLCFTVNSVSAERFYLQAVWDHGVHHAFLFFSLAEQSCAVVDFCSVTERQHFPFTPTHSEATKAWAVGIYWGCACFIDRRCYMSAGVRLL